MLLREISINDHAKLWDIEPLLKCSMSVLRRSVEFTSKISRTRTLRAKYRDLFQRQTVKTQKGPAAARRPAGNDNNRTEVKAEIMQEVLGRLEERLTKVQAAAEKAAAKPAVAKSTKTAAVKSAAKKPAAAAKKATTAAPRKATAKTASKPVAKSTRKARPAAATKAAAVKKAAGASKATKAPAKKAASAAASPAKARKTAAGTAKVAGNAAAAARGAVPTSQPAAASRGNPIKAQPINKKIQASGQSKTRAAQAKRDSR
jgi:hypothetical protein